jgi:hypothetical protein
MYDTLSSKRLDHLENHIDRIAKDLERLGEQVRRAKGQVRKGPQFGGPEAAIEEVLHAVSWGYANLNLSGMLATLRDYRDYLKAEAEHV